MWTREADGSVIDEATGKIIFFSTERFVNDICLGDCCFICGAKQGEKEFNNEHILPEWLLRRFNLFDRVITLTNGATVQYSRYTLPCCADCNSLMGDEIERPLSEAISGGLDALIELIKKTR
ncbi:MAG: HNH endonuclease [Alphaproteobacteria bacterium]|nr:MAG: HNH endonuclease [Alphaproteobacteria bacterium]